MVPDKAFFGMGALLGFAGVAAGAFGAHALRGRLSPEMLAVFETGVRYQLIHALALLASAWAFVHYGAKPALLAGWFFAAGAVVFSGSLYILALTGARWWGAVTPIGGLLLLGGWLSLLAASWRG